MNRYVKLIGGIALLVVLLGGSYFLYNNLSEKYTTGSNLMTNEDKKDDNQESKEPEKAAALDFTVIDRNNQEKTLFSFKGKPVVLNFWASWCGPCNYEFPDFQKAYEQYGKDIEFVMVNLTDGSRETKETAEKHIDSNGYTFPIYFDVNQDAANTYAIYSIPTTYFIDKDGYIVASARGMLEAKALQTGIDMIR